MSEADKFTSMKPEDPEFYAELLSKIPRTTNRCQPSDGQSCPNVPGIQKLDFALSRRLQTLLDAVANISLCQRGNVAATMASVKDNTGTLETQLYIVFNHQNDESVLACTQHLQNIINMLRRVPFASSATDGSPKVIPRELESNQIEICQAIHDYSFEVFQYRVTKREHKLLEIRRYIEQDQTNYFSDQERRTLLEFLHNVDRIIAVTTTTTTDQFPTVFIKALLGLYSSWTHNDILPKDPLADNKLTLLDRADTWLAKNRIIGFQLRRWALKIMSFVIATNRLFILSQSHRLRGIIDGNISVKVLSSLTTTPYRCHLSSETIQTALKDSAAETGSVPYNWDNNCEWFITEVLRNGEEPIDVDHSTPTVHAELAMIMAMVKGEIEDILPYIGVSKLSCTMCSHYIGAFNQVCKQNIVTKGSHGKAYPGWSWPSFPDHDNELRLTFLGRVRRQLLNDLALYAGRRLSDNSVGSGGPEMEKIPTSEVDEWFAELGL